MGEGDGFLFFPLAAQHEGSGFISVYIYIYIYIDV
jgi:hypothetical protein